MQNLILFLYILICAMGFAGLLSLVFMRLRIRSPVLLPLFMTYLLLFIALGLVAVYFYLENVLSLIGGSHEFFRKILIGLSTVNNIALYVTLLIVSSCVLNYQERRSPLAVLFKLLCVSIMLLISAGIVLRAFFATAVPFISPLTYVLTSISIPYLGLLLFRAKSSGVHSSIRFLIRGVAVCCFFYAPLSGLEYLLKVMNLHVYQPLSMDYLFLLAFTCYAIIAAVKSLGDGSGATTVELTDDTAARFALTNREREMITLIAQGLTNKEIAYELNISPATVRTHIYNLYQKTGVQSRIALINKISSEV